VGSTTSGIAGRASIPVICIPDDWDGTSVRDVRVTVGVDETLSDSELVGNAFELAERSSGSLTFLHAWYVPSIYEDTVLGQQAQTVWSERDKASITEALEPWRRAHPGIPVDVQVEHGRPGDVLVDASRHCDLIMLGRHHSAHRLPHLGALTRAVLREARCPVEVVPALGRRETEPSFSGHAGASL
jgi:nucleotide-binding universal stress UspA family protein